LAPFQLEINEKDDTLFQDEQYIRWSRSLRPWCEYLLFGCVIWK
jgi:hypothetical protein